MKDVSVDIPHVVTSSSHSRFAYRKLKGIKQVWFKKVAHPTSLSLSHSLSSPVLSPRSGGGTPFCTYFSYHPEAELALALLYAEVNSINPT